MLHSMWRSEFPAQGSNLRLLQWKLGVLASGPPEVVPKKGILKKCFLFLALRMAAVLGVALDRLWQLQTFRKLTAQTRWDRQTPTTSSLAAPRGLNMVWWKL